MDWWGKPDHLKEGAKKSTKPQSRTTRRRSTTRAKKTPLTTKQVILRVLKHGAYAVVIIVLGAVASHFILTSITRHNARCIVPQLESLTMEEAQALVAADELKLIINDSLYATQYKSGAILDQLPKAGMEVKPGRTIYLTVNASQQRMVDVPYVADRSLRQAKNMLEMEGLTIGELIYEDDLAKNYILSQHLGDKEVKPNSALRAPIGSQIDLHVGRGDADSTLMPLLLGLTLREAKSALWNTGLNVGDIKYDKESEDPSSQAQARVFSQSREAERNQLLGAKV